MLFIKSIILSSLADFWSLVPFVFTCLFKLGFLLLTLLRLVLFSSLSPFLLLISSCLVALRSYSPEISQIVSCTGPDNHSPVILSASFLSFSSSLLTILTWKNALPLQNSVPYLRNLRFLHFWQWATTQKHFAGLKLFYWLSVMCVVFLCIWCVQPKISSLHKMMWASQRIFVELTPHHIWRQMVTYKSANLKKMYCTVLKHCYARFSVKVARPFIYVILFRSHVGFIKHF